MILKRARAVSTTLEKEYWKNARATAFFFRRLLGQRVFFPSGYDIKSEKEDEDIWWMKLQMIEV